MKSLVPGVVAEIGLGGGVGKQPTFGGFHWHEVGPFFGLAVLILAMINVAETRHLEAGESVVQASFGLNQVVEHLNHIQATECGCTTGGMGVEGDRVNILELPGRLDVPEEHQILLQLYTDHTLIWLGASTAVAVFLIGDQLGRGPVDRRIFRQKQRPAVEGEQVNARVSPLSLAEARLILEDVGHLIAVRAGNHHHSVCLIQPVPFGVQQDAIFTQIGYNSSIFNTQHAHFFPPSVVVAVKRTAKTYHFKLKKSIIFVHKPICQQANNKVE